jgi:hypothetical protein
VFTEENSLREVSPNDVLVDDEPSVRVLLKRQRVSSLLSPPQAHEGDKTMESDLKEIISQLKLQRDIVKDGGYGRSVRTPGKEERLFRDSVTCLNVTEQVKKHPCNECLLWEWVPEEHKDEDIPCQFIPLNQQGQSIAELEEAGKREEAEQALLVWLDSTIQRLEEKLAKQIVSCQ